MKGAIRARSTGELARIKLPKMDLIWLECIRVERRSRNDKLAESLLAKALKECPTSGALWAEELLTCNKQQRKSKSIDALKKCNNDPIVIVAVARLFEKDNKVTKARKWFNRAVALNGKLGDAWVYYYALEYVQTYKKVLLTEKHRVKRIDKVDSSNFVTGIYNSGSDFSAIETMVTKDETHDDDGEEEDDDDIEEEELGKQDGDVTVKKEPGVAVEGEATIASGTNGKTAQTVDGDNGADTGGLSILRTLEKKCMEAAPNTGELWCSMSKETKLRRQPIGDILRTVAERTLGFSVQ